MRTPALLLQRELVWVFNSNYGAFIQEKKKKEKREERILLVFYTGDSHLSRRERGVEGVSKKSMIR